MTELITFISLVSLFIWLFNTIFSGVFRIISFIALGILAVRFGVPYLSEGVPAFSNLFRSGIEELRAWVDDEPSFDGQYGQYDNGQYGQYDNGQYNNGQYNTGQSGSGTIQSLPDDNASSDGTIQSLPGGGSQSGGGSFQDRSFTDSQTTTPVPGSTVSPSRPNSQAASPPPRVTRSPLPAERQRPVTAWW